MFLEAFSPNLHASSRLPSSSLQNLTLCSKKQSAFEIKLNTQTALYFQSKVGRKKEQGTSTVPYNHEQRRRIFMSSLKIGKESAMSIDY
jgi:hypothetical protein